MYRAAFLVLCALGSVCLGSAPASADPVVLTSKDGFTSFEGDLLRVDNEFYVLNTSVGQVKIPQSSVTCQGPGCPAATPAADKSDRLPPEITQDDQNQLFQEFLEWRKKNAN